MRTRASEGLEEAKRFAKSLDFEEVKSGEWFVKLLQNVVRSYDRNARAEYFRQKYPGLPSDDIADILTSVTTRFAAVAGGVAGAAATSAQVSTLGTAGMTAPLFLGAIGAEMIYLSRIQLRLVLDLSVVYDLHLDPEDPEDVLMVFGYALGVAPTEILGTTAVKAAGGGTKTLVKRYVSKNVLKAIQDFARKLGFKILQRTILKYAVPVVSAAVGGSYNYATTRALGAIAKSHFRSRGKVTAELHSLLSPKNTYDPAFPAAALHIAGLDGQFSSNERGLYKAMLSRMSFSEGAQAELERLVEDEEVLLAAVSEIGEPGLRRTLMSLLVLMAACDGEISGAEQGFLSEAAARLELPLNPNDAENRAREYRDRDHASSVAKAARSLANGALGTGSKVKGRLGKILARNPSEREVRTDRPEEV